MVKEEGTVVRMSEGRAIVAVVQTSACHSCNARQGCGQAVLSEWGDAGHQMEKNHFSISYQGLLTPGDRVLLGIEEDALALAAVWIYLWPLVAAFAALLFASRLGGTELVQLLTAVAGGGLAFMITRRRFKHQSGKQRWQPQILAVESRSGQLIARASQ